MEFIELKSYVNREVTKKSLISLVIDLKNNVIGVILLDSKVKYEVYDGRW